MSLLSAQKSVLELPEFHLLNGVVESLLERTEIQQYAQLTSLFTPQMHVVSSSTTPNNRNGMHTTDLHGLLLCMLSCLSSYRKSNVVDNVVPPPLVPTGAINQLPSINQFIPVRPMPVYAAPTVVRPLCKADNEPVLPLHSSSSAFVPKTMGVWKMNERTRLSWSQIRAIGSERWPRMFRALRNQTARVLPRCIKHLHKNKVRCNPSCRRRFWTRCNGVTVGEVDHYEKQIGASGTDVDCLENTEDLSCGYPVFRSE